MQGLFVFKYALLFCTILWGIMLAVRVDPSRGEMFGMAVDWAWKLFVYSFPLSLVFGLYVGKRIVPKQSGWDRLAERYAMAGKQTRVRLRGTDGQMGEIAHHNCYRLGATRDGVQFAAAFLIWPGHPRLYIPWSAVRLVPVVGLPIERGDPNPAPAVRLVVTTHPGVELYVTRETFDRTNVLEHAPQEIARALVEATPVRPAALRNFGALSTA